MDLKKMIVASPIFSSKLTLHCYAKVSALLNGFVIALKKI